jgi:hypothetical protein
MGWRSEESAFISISHKSTHPTHRSHSERSEESAVPRTRQRMFPTNFFSNHAVELFRLGILNIESKKGPAIRWAFVRSGANTKINHSCDVFEIK